MKKAEIEGIDSGCSLLISRGWKRESYWVTPVRDIVWGDYAFSFKGIRGQWAWDHEEELEIMVLNYDSVEKIEDCLVV